MLPLTLFFIYRHDYSFSSGKNGCSVIDLSLFWEARQSKNKHLLRLAFLITTFNPEEVLNK